MMLYSIILCLLCISCALLSITCNASSSSYFAGDGLFAVIDGYTLSPKKLPDSYSGVGRYPGFLGVSGLALDSAGNIYFSARSGVLELSFNNQEALYTGDYLTTEENPSISGSGGLCIFNSTSLTALLHISLACLARVLMEITSKMELLQLRQILDILPTLLWTPLTIYTLPKQHIYRDREFKKLTETMAAYPYLINPYGGV